jgi:hypothetical protein
MVEDLDRISRDDIGETPPLFMGILKVGVSVVTMSPERETRLSRPKRTSVSSWRW